MMPSLKMLSPSRNPPADAEVTLETLPPVVLRKYFSSLERLRLAQDGSSFSTPSPPARPPSRISILSPTKIWAASPPSDTIAVLSQRLLQTGLPFNRNRLRRRRCSAADIQSSTVTWFASLSPAVQKKLFSMEECSFYSQERHSIILDAADETLRRRSWHPSQFAGLEPHVSDDDATIVDSEDLKGEDWLDVDVELEMGDYSIDGFRWLEDDAELDLKLDDYHQAIAETARRTTSMPQPIKRPSRRNTSLSSLSIRRGRSSTSSSRPQIDLSPTPALPPELSHVHSSTFSLKHIRSQASLSSKIDPRATHYQDPAARMKLRVYLGSPQKFDEAIEFGFPAVNGKPLRSPVRPMTSPQPRPEVNRTFFHDDTPELSGDDGDDGDEPEGGLFDPRTPEDPVFHMHRPSHKSSVDGSVGLRPFSVRRQPESYACGLTSDREMTLHMTLTRPDLRSPKDKPLEAPPRAINTPLERSELAPEGDPVSIWDTLPAEESKVKRFFRKLRLK